MDVCSTVWRTVAHTLTRCQRRSCVSHADTFPLCPYLNQRSPRSAADVRRRRRRGRRRGGAALRSGGVREQHGDQSDLHHVAPALHSATARFLKVHLIVSRASPPSPPPPPLLSRPLSVVLNALSKGASGAVTDLLFILARRAL